MAADNSNLLDGTIRNVNDMFFGREYGIEYYQREYSWEETNIDELLSDLSRSFLGDYAEGHTRKDVAKYRPYFLGPVVTYSFEGTRYLVDGQQRMTSLCLLLIHLSQLSDDEVLSSKLSQLVFREKYGEKSFTINVDDRRVVMEAIFGNMTSQPFDLDASSINIWERFQDIKSIFPEELTGDLLPFFCDWLTERVMLVDIGTTDKDMALEIFESMNDRGLQLTSLDMLKSYLLSRIRDEANIQSANTVWRKEFQDLNDLHKNADSEFVKTLLRAKYAETVRETKKMTLAQDFEEIATVFHKWTRDNAERIGLIRPEDFQTFIVNTLPKFARVFKRLEVANQSLVPGLEYVYYCARNNFTLQNMVIIASIDEFDGPEVVDKKANLIACYLDFMISSRMAQYKNFGYSPMYRPMFLLAKQLRGKNLEQIGELLIERASDFDSDLKDVKNLRLTKNNKPDIYYLLSRVTAWLEDKPADFYLEKNPKDPFEVEHIWADKFERHADQFSSEYEFQERRNSIGDLLLLPKSFNASYGDLPFNQKVTHYLKHNLLAQSLNEDAYSRSPRFLRLIDEYQIPIRSYGPDEFNAQAISERAELFQVICSKIWSTDVIRDLVQ